jgi:hypothetical protein|tara:strand:+ start:119 stop:700 length:582 start_codon:yes stop_codon:yes gene_type:complete
MANRNTVGFGLIAQGTLGSTDQSQGQGKYYIQANYATGMYQGTSVLQSAGYITTGQAAITNLCIGVLNGVFYNAATTEKPTWQNYYSQVTPANSENITAFVIDNPKQLYVGCMDTAIPIANMGKTFGMSTTTGSTTSGQSTNKMLLAGGHATNNTWRTVRIAEDPENSDITAANCSVVFVQNLNQYASGATMA